MSPEPGYSKTQNTLLRILICVVRMQEKSIVNDTIRQAGRPTPSLQSVIRIKTVLIFTRNLQAQNLKCKMAGLLTCSIYRAFPAIYEPVAKSSANKYSLRNGTHSNRYCPGFSPDSLFSIKAAKASLEPIALQN